MKLTEWVDQARTFTSDEMQKCATKGECGKCGLFCVAFMDELPIQIPEAIGAPVRITLKQVMTVCPHLKTNGEGESLCGAHTMKGHRSLWHCADWQGHKPFSDFRMSNFEMAMINYWNWVTHEASGQDLLAAEEMIAKGLITKIIFRGFDPELMENFLKRVLHSQAIPRRIFTALQMGVILQRSQPKHVKKLKQNLGLNKKSLSAVERDLLAYFPKN